MDRLARTFLLAAAVSALALAGAHLLGWRAHTAFLAGNAVAWGEVVRGALYAVLWVQAVVLVPPLLVATVVALLVREAPAD